MSKVTMEIDLDLNKPADLELMQIVTHWKRTGTLSGVAVGVPLPQVTKPQGVTVSPEPHKKLTRSEKASKAANARWAKEGKGQVTEMPTPGEPVVMSADVKMPTQQDFIADMQRISPPTDGRSIMENFGGMSNEEFQAYITDMREKAYGKEEIQRSGSE